MLIAFFFIVRQTSASLEQGLFLGEGAARRVVDVATLARDAELGLTP